MESLIATVVFIAGLVVRLALPPLALALVIAVPAVMIFVAVRGWEALREKAIGLTHVGGLLWKPGLSYTLGHTWVNRDGAAWRVGFDDLAQRVLVGARAVELPQPGAMVHEGQAATLVTCGERRVAIASPVDGVVTAVNQAVSKDPSVIHTDPYARGWLFSVAPANPQNGRWLRGEAARRWFREEGARFAQFLECNLGVAAADGGELLFPASSLLSDEQWDVLTAMFLGPGRPGSQAISERNNSETARRLPRALVPFAGLLAVIAGGLYIVFLPVIGFGMIFWFTGVWAWRGLRHVTARVGAPVLRNRRPAG